MSSLESLVQSERARTSACGVQSSTLSVVDQFTSLAEALASWNRVLPVSPVTPQDVFLRSCGECTSVKSEAADSVCSVVAFDSISATDLSVTRSPRHARPGYAITFALQLSSSAALPSSDLTAASVFISTHFSVEAEIRDASLQLICSAVPFTITRMTGSVYDYMLSVYIPATAQVGGSVLITAMSLAGSALLTAMPPDIPITNGGLNAPFRFGESIVSEGQSKRCKTS
jgi:hypothetical protein